MTFMMVIVSKSALACDSCMYLLSVTLTFREKLGLVVIFVFRFRISKCVELNWKSCGLKDSTSGSALVPLPVHGESVQPLLLARLQAVTCYGVSGATLLAPPLTPQPPGDLAPRLWWSSIFINCSVHEFHSCTFHGFGKNVWYWTPHYSNRQDLWVTPARNRWKPRVGFSFSGCSVFGIVSYVAFPDCWLRVSAIHFAFPHVL